MCHNSVLILFMINLLSLSIRTCGECPYAITLGQKELIESMLTPAKLDMS